MTPIGKYRLKTLAAGLGFSLRPEPPRRTTMAQFCRHLKRWGYVPGAILDVGVADGTFDIYTAFPAVKYLLIEPLAEFEPALRWIASHYNARYALVAAGATEGVGFIHVGATVAEKHGASLLHGREDKVYGGWELRQVPIRRLDRLVEEHRLSGPFLLKIDTQGTELDVLTGAEGILSQIEVVILEASFYNFGQKQGQPLVGDVLAFMAGRGFYPYDVFGGCNRPLDGALAQIDIAFVQRDGLFRRDHRYQDFACSVPLHHRLISQVRGWVGV